jgi:hypothetical protein
MAVAESMNQNKVKNPAAVALGKLGAGKPKNYSKEELAKRTARLKGLKKTLLLALAAGALAGNARAGVVEYQGMFISDQDAARFGLSVSTPTPAPASEDPYHVVARLAQKAAKTPEAEQARARLLQMHAPLPVHPAGGDFIDDTLAYSKLLTAFLKTHPIPGRIPSEKSMNLFDLLQTAAIAEGYGEYAGFVTEVAKQLEDTGALTQQ